MPIALGIPRSFAASRFQTANPQHAGVNSWDTSRCSYWRSSRCFVRRRHSRRSHVLYATVIITLDCSVHDDACVTVYFQSIDGTRLLSFVKNCGYKVNVKSFGRYHCIIIMHHD